VHARHSSFPQHQFDQTNTLYISHFGSAFLMIESPNLTPS
jgi:hypothetical protein